MMKNRARESLLQLLVIWARLFLLHRWGARLVGQGGAPNEDEADWAKKLAHPSFNTSRFLVFVTVFGE
jgi:hypothetical protein